MNVVLCSSFIKQLNKLKSVNIEDVKSLLKRYPNTTAIRPIANVEGTEVLKCYLLQKKVRSIVFLRYKNSAFIPISIVRKETKKGKNITKDNFEELYNGEILRIEEDLKNKQFEIEEL